MIKSQRIYSEEKLYNVLSARMRLRGRGTRRHELSSSFARYRGSRRLSLLFRSLMKPIARLRTGTTGRSRTERVSGRFARSSPRAEGAVGRASRARLVLYRSR